VGQQLAVDEQHGITGMVDDPVQFLARKAWVQGMEYAPGGTNAQHQFQVIVAVESQRGDAFARLHARGVKRGRNAPRPARQVRVASPAHHLTITGGVVGSPGELALQPLEQAS
jgi:hypothetical protein